MAGLSEIAKAAGVSVSTVSRVLNRRAGVNQETRQRVLTVLAEMPYTSRGIGALRRTGVIGLLVPELSNPVFPAFAEALETRAASAGYASMLCNTRSLSPQGLGEEEYVRMLLTRGVEGMIFVSPDITNQENAAAGTTGRVRSHYRRLVDDGVQLVFVNGGAATLDVPDVRVDEQLAGYTATRHLLELGHRDIGFVSGPAYSLPSRLKHAGWAAAMEEAGHAATPELVAQAPYGAAGGSSALRELLERTTVTGVICSSDHMALGVVAEARRRDLRVPADLSVVGFDDSALAAYCGPPLTTLAQPIGEMAASAVAELIERLEPAADNRPGTFSRVFRPRLVVRESTAPPAV
ncbi:LacI family DNA-binding transcriptional regulator [Actinoalloteichus hymeniacidonis]|uniref:Transcriptional regulator, LacI family n=1 Tax=Actinoalloteichus hymeniacidonis TaxID=340345 RepID=A0AAC9MWF8_9PSEU|nr:LacI family DNA-binding transcriptional regulator [Actinoalloteichus hymeniacidonis]AOS61230.1 transcriptional regulator, LacI family [Actinoalloteichus hymeniacidonis]MBB5910767.1 DNA-binding LacI/PurR family transcriptional regulator [Actinoalloteichus hymeniacidonis]